MNNDQKIREIAEQHSSDESEIAGFVVLTGFLQEHKKLAGGFAANKDLTNEDEIVKLSKKYFEYRNAQVILRISKTVPDPLIREILCQQYEYAAEDLEDIEEIHRRSMATENIIGELLERYLDSVISDHGWVRCCGSLVKSVDFIKRKKAVNQYEMLQVKNRDNSENSSSKAIRDGTDIKHWFRTISRTGATNWGNFPDDQCRSLLSEKDFKRYALNLVKIK